MSKTMERPGLTAAQVRGRRRALGLGQADLARLFDVKQQSISQWENGRRTVPAWMEGELARLEDEQDAAICQLMVGGEPGLPDSDPSLEVAQALADRRLRCLAEISETAS